jgi:hypothetical protein
MGAGVSLPELPIPLGTCFRKPHAEIHLPDYPSSGSVTQVELAATGATLLPVDAPLGWAMLWAGVVLAMDGLATRAERDEREE